MLSNAVSLPLKREGLFLFSDFYTIYSELKLINSTSAEIMTAVY